MEEDDELVPNADERGFLNISNRAWVNLDPVIWTMSTKIVKLDMSYNHILEIPAQIGELIMLRYALMNNCLVCVLRYNIEHCRELLASFNKITVVPPQIGKLKRLRRLILNSNKIKHIPDDIGQLDMLEELVLSENNIEDIPVSLSLMSNLKVIKLANNRLKTIPYEIADILTLEEIDCSNNHHLESIPAKWRGDTDSVLFTCRVHRGMR
jgi:leucine-rich repeat protein SHOC2